MGWWNGSFLGWDTETTGTDPETARIVSASVVYVDGKAGVTDVWEVLVNPGVEISAEATAIHGITNEQVQQEGMYPQAVLNELVNTLAAGMWNETPVVAFNARFDFTVLDRDCRRNDVQTLSYRTGDILAPVIDPYVLDKGVDTYRKGSRTLGATCDLYGITLDAAHTASADALAAVDLARAVILGHQSLQIPLPKIHRVQEIWAAQQANSLQRYLRQKHDDDTIVCSPHWPLIPQEAGEWP
jgi:DNA polymerase-3 subunit epsilon